MELYWFTMPRIRRRVGYCYTCNMTFCESVEKGAGGSGVSEISIGKSVH